MRTMFAAVLLGCATARAQEQAVPAVVVSGEVVTMHGEPVAGARVEVTQRDVADKILCTLTTDAAGSFTSKRLPGGREFVLRAATATSSIAAATVSSPPPPVRLVVFDGITLRGQLLAADGSPLPGIEVRALPWLERSGDVVAMTQPDGSFALPNLPHGRVRVVAAIPGQGMWIANHVAVGDDNVTLAPLQANTRDLDLRVEGLLADQVAGTRIELRPTTFWGLPRAWELPRFAADGTCVLRGLPDWNFHVRLHRPGVLFEPETATLQTPGVHTFRARTATDTRQLVVRVVGAGKLEAQANVVATTAVGSFLATRGNDGCFVVKIAPSTGKVRLALANTKVVAWAASFDTEGHLPPSAVASLQSGLVLPIGTKPEEVILELQVAEPASLAGSVLDSAGGPAAGCVVRLEHRQTVNAWFDDTVRSTVTDAQGCYTFVGLPPIPGGLRVLAVAAQGHSQSREVPMPKAAATTTMEPLQLMLFARVHGVVRDRHGKPAPGVRVRALPFDLASQRLAGSGAQEVVSDGEGRYAFTTIACKAVLLQTLVQEGTVSTRACAPFATPEGETIAHDLTVELP